MSSTSKNLYLTIIAGSIILCLAFGARSTFGLFMIPISEEFGGAKAMFALAVAFQNLLWGVMQPLAGGFADRYGSARVIFVCGLLYIAGMVLMATAQTPAMMHISAGFLVGTALAGTGFGVVLAAIARAVPEQHRSMALGIGTAAGSVGQMLIVPLGQSFISEYGWSTAALLLAAMLALILPLSAFLRGSAGVASSDQTLRAALSEAARQRSYWLLTMGFFVCGFHVSFIGTHIPGYLVDEGLPQSLGAAALMVIGGFNIIGSLAAGYYGGRMSKKYLLSSIYLARAILMAGFVLLPTTTTTVIVFAAVMGILWLSTVPLTSALVGQIFGVKFVGTLFGIVFLSHQIGSFLGVWLGGELFDRTGSYDIVWWMGVALGVFSAILHWPIDERPLVRVPHPANA